MSLSLPAGRALARRIATFQQAVEHWGGRKKELLTQELALRGKVLSSPSQARSLVSSELHQLQRDLLECEFLLPIFTNELKRLRSER